MSKSTATNSRPSIDLIIEQLRAARDAASLKVARAQAELNQITQALKALEKDIVVNTDDVRAQDFAGLGIVKATWRFLKEANTEKTTNEIAEELKARGVVSKSKNFIPTVYATLRNAKKDFVRKEQGREGTWALTDASSRVSR